MGRKIFTALIALIFLYIVWPMMFPVIMGAVFATLSYPLLERMERRKWKTGSASAILTLVILLGVLIPVATLTYLGAKTGVEQVQAYRSAPKSADGASWLENVLAMPQLESLTAWLANWFPNGLEQLQETASEVSRGVAARVAELLGALITQLPGIVMAIAVIVVSVYFFLADGRKLVAFFRRHSMFSPVQTDELVRTLAVMCRSVILASVVSGFIQSFTMVIGLLVTGTPNVLFIGFLVFLASFVPVIGSAPVTFGVAIHQLILGRTVPAIVLMVFAILVGISDNFVRPVFLRGAANLHPLLAFVAAFGGLQTLGFLGVFLGPIVAALFVATISIITRDEPPLAITHK